MTKTFWPIIVFGVGALCGLSIGAPWALSQTLDLPLGLSAGSTSPLPKTSLAKTNLVPPKLKKLISELPPKNKKALSELVSCLEKKSGNANNASQLACELVFNKEFHQLNENLNEINSTAFLQELEAQIWNNLSRTWADLSYRARESNEDKILPLCQYFARVRQHHHCSDEIAQRDQIAFNKELEALKKQNIPLQKEAFEDIIGILKTHRYLSACREANYQNRNDKLAQQTKNTAEYAIGLIVNEKKIDQTLAPYVLLAPDFEGLVQHENIVFGLENALHTARAELVSQVESLMKIQNDSPTERLPDLIASYPVATGQVLAKFPKAVGIVCENWPKTNETFSQVFGDQIQPGRIIEIASSNNSTLDSIAKAQMPQEPLERKNLVDKQCQEIVNAYKNKKNQGASQQDLEKAKQEFEEARNNARNGKKAWWPAINLSAPSSAFSNFKNAIGVRTPPLSYEFVESRGLRADLYCPSEDQQYINAYKIEVYKSEIEIINAIEADPRLAQIFRDFKEQFVKLDKGGSAEKAGLANAKYTLFLTLLSHLKKETETIEDDQGNKKTIPGWNEVLKAIKNNYQGKDFNDPKVFNHFMENIIDKIVPQGALSMSC